MKTKLHRSAKPSHYNKEADSYDAFNEKNAQPMNSLIESFLKKHSVHTVLDLTCGTGSQVFWLANSGYEVTGVDINSRMLKIAKSKANKEQALKLIKGDMRSTYIGQFDAVITMFNSIGHLTKNDFEVAANNINKNLKINGLYIFDIFNLNFLLEGNNITRLTIDWQEVVDGNKFREIQYSTISQDGILASYDIYIEQKDSNTKTSRCSQTLQVYSANQLKTILEANGFKVLHQCGMDGIEITENKTERIITVAKKTKDPRNAKEEDAQAF